MSLKVDILLVEDNMVDAEFTIRALRKNNIHNGLLHLPDGEQALEYVFGTGKFAGRNTLEMPKVVLLDIKMPKVDGLEVLRQMKSDERVKGIPVVLLTSSNQERDVLEGYNLGVNSYVVKPIGFEQYEKAVSELGLYWLMRNLSPPGE